MYYYLHGLVAMHLKNSIVVECGGIGYECLVSHVDEFPIGEILFVYVYQVINENDNYLIGFKTNAEKSLFISLISVKGIGPKSALNALSFTSCERLSRAIDEADELFLTKIPGLGRKSASQIILDLKGKLNIENINYFAQGENYDLVCSALKNLGFKDKEIKEAIGTFDLNKMSIESAISSALRILNDK